MVRRRGGTARTGRGSGFFSETCVRAEVYGSSGTIVRRYLRILIAFLPVYGVISVSGVGVDDSVPRRRHCATSGHVVGERASWWCCHNVTAAAYDGSCQFDERRSRADISTDASASGLPTQRVDGPSTFQRYGRDCVAVMSVRDSGCRFISFGFLRHVA